MIATVTAWQAANATLAAALAVFGAWAVRFCYIRARAADALIDQILQEPVPEPGITVWDDAAKRWHTLPPGTLPGPSQYTVREVEALDDLVLAWEADAFDPATDPQWTAARERLLADLNDQQKEGQ